MHAEAIVAEQTSRNSYQQRPPLPPREMEHDRSTGNA